MPPRFVYWTIVIDGTPTAFRAATRSELLPTLRQIQRKTPTAEMRWFARGRLWSSPEEATATMRVEAARRWKPRARPRHSRGRTDTPRDRSRRRKP